MSGTPSAIYLHDEAVCMSGTPSAVYLHDETVCMSATPSVIYLHGEAVCMSGTPSAIYLHDEAVCMSGTPSAIYLHDEAVCMSGTPSAIYLHDETVCMSGTPSAIYLHDEAVCMSGTPSAIYLHDEAVCMSGTPSTKYLHGEAVCMSGTPSAIYLHDEAVCMRGLAVILLWSSGWLSRIPTWLLWHFFLVIDFAPKEKMHTDTIAYLGGQGNSCRLCVFTVYYSLSPNLPSIYCRFCHSITNSWCRIQYLNCVWFLFMARAHLIQGMKWEWSLYGIATWVAPHWNLSILVSISGLLSAQRGSHECSHRVGSSYLPRLGYHASWQNWNFNSWKIGVMLQTVWMCMFVLL